MRLTLPSVILALCGAGAAASAEPDRAIEIDPNGAVVVGGVEYPDMTSYHRSAEFRDGERRCGTPEPVIPIADFAPTDCSFGSTTIGADYDPEAGATFDIPVVFHVIAASDGRGDLSEELVRSQVEILNEDFNALAGTPGAPGTNTRIRFVLASYDPEGNPTDGILRYTDDGLFTSPESAKSSLNWDPSRYFNIYSVDPGGGILGYATFPQESAGDSDDGVVLLWTSVGRDAPMGGVFNQGRTGTHEVGHYLGLFHTFQDGCDGADPYSSGDRIADTVNQAQPSSGCPEGPSACGGGDNPIHNYMDYSDDVCMDNFTAEQANRMRCSIIHYRPTLINEVPAVAFEHADDVFTIEFTDASEDSDGDIETWEWDFGDGASSTEQNPTHTYDDFGLYTVTLTVTDDRGSRASYSEDVAANILPEARIGADRSDLEVQFSDESSDENGTIVAWAWDFGDGETSTEENPTHVYAMDGTYQITLVVTDDLGGTATATKEIDTTAGCMCTAGGSSGPPWAEAALMGLALLSLRRRRQRSAESASPACNRP